MRYLEDWEIETGIMTLSLYDEDNEVSDIEEVELAWFNDQLNKAVLPKIKEYKRNGGKFDVVALGLYLTPEEVKRIVLGNDTFETRVVWEEWIKRLKLKYLRNLLKQLLQEGKSNSDCMDIIDKIQETERPKTAIMEGSFQTAIRTAIDEMDEEMKPEFKKYFTGINLIDDYLGSLRKKRLYIIGGKPGCCKTNLAIKIMHSLIIQEITAIYFTSEMSASSILQRMACMQLDRDGDISYSDVVEGRMTPDKIRVFTHEMNKLYKYKSWFIETSRFDLNTIKKQIQKTGASVVFLDFVQMFRLSDSKEENRAAAMSEIASQLKELAMDMDIIVIALSQLNQQGELKESGGLNEKADCVITLSLKENGAIIKTIDANITKNRYGDTGKIELSLYKKTIDIFGLM